MEESLSAATLLLSVLYGQSDSLVLVGISEPVRESGFDSLPADEVFRTYVKKFANVSE